MSAGASHEGGLVDVGRVSAARPEDLGAAPTSSVSPDESSHKNLKSSCHESLIFDRKHDQRMNTQPKKEQGASTGASIGALELALGLTLELALGLALELALELAPVPNWPVGCFQESVALLCKYKRAKCLRFPTCRETSERRLHQYFWRGALPGTLIWMPCNHALIMRHLNWHITAAEVLDGNPSRIPDGLLGPRLV